MPGTKKKFIYQNYTKMHGQKNIATHDTSFLKPLLLVIRCFHPSFPFSHKRPSAAITNKLLITGRCMWSFNDTLPAPNVAVFTKQLLV
jgi:hypothetical protein